MAKQPPSNKTPHDPAQPSRNTGHPLLKNATQVQAMIDRAAGRDAAKEFEIEELDKWRLSLNRIAATPDGKALFRAMISFSDLFTPPGNSRDTVKMVEDKNKAAFYLKWVRPYLDSSLRKDIE